MKSLYAKYALVFAMIFAVNVSAPVFTVSNANAEPRIYAPLIQVSPPPDEYCPQWGWPGIIVCEIIVAIDAENVNMVGNAAWLGGYRATAIGNAASKRDNYYRDLCVRSAPLKIDDFNEYSGELTKAVSKEYDAMYGGLLTGSRPAHIGSDSEEDRKKQSCMPLVNTIKFETPTTGNKAFSYYRNANDVDFVSDGIGKSGNTDQYKLAYGFTQDNYKSTTFPVNGVLGCVLTAGTDAQSWKQAMSNCYDQYIIDRAEHKEWTLERTGTQTDDPLTAIDSERAIFKSCQPLAEGDNSISNDKEKAGSGYKYKGYSPVLQYKGRADVDEAEFPVHTPCVAVKESISPDINTGRWSAFNATAISAYATIASMECIFTLGNYCNGPVFHALIPDDVTYQSKGYASDKTHSKFCPNIEKINDPTHPFAPRQKTVKFNPVGSLLGFAHTTDRDYSGDTSHTTIKERLSNGPAIGYNKTSGMPDTPAVQCAIVPVDILKIRKDQFDSCIMQRINFNFWSWRFNNFLEWYSLNDSNWEPPCKTRFFETDSYAQCPVQRSIQQCCRIIVKDVTPYNYLKLRTCEGLRQKRMDKLGYDHIYDGGGKSENGKHVAYNDYQTAKAEEKKLKEAGGCSNTEPDDYRFKTYFSAYSYGILGYIEHATGYKFSDAETKVIEKKNEALTKAGKSVAVIQDKIDKAKNNLSNAIDDKTAAISAENVANGLANEAQQKLNNLVAGGVPTDSVKLIAYKAAEKSLKNTISTQTNLAKSAAQTATKKISQIANYNSVISKLENQLTAAKDAATKLASDLTDTISSDIKGVTTGNQEFDSKLTGLVNVASGGAAEPANMPYMRWWDTGTSAGNTRHGGSFINTLGGYDVIIGVGREERSKQDYIDITGDKKEEGGFLTDQAGNKLTKEEQPTSRASEMGRIDGWTGLKGHQMWTTRRNNLVCIGRHEKLFKQGSLEEFLVSRAGGSYTNSNANTKNESGKDVQIVGKSWNWPMNWQGYSSRSPVSGGSGGDNVKKGDIISFNISDLSYYAYVTNANVKSEPKFIEIEAMDQGKFPTSTGASLSWGKITKRTIYKDKVPSYESGVTAKISKVSTDKIALVGDQPSCEDPNFVSCVLPDGGWDNIKVANIGNATPKCDINFVKKLMVEKGMDGSDKITNQPQSVPANIWSYCLNAGFAIPDHLRSPDGYNGPGAGAIQDTTLCGSSWGSCSAVGNSKSLSGTTKTKYFPENKATATGTNSSVSGSGGVGATGGTGTAVSTSSTTGGGSTGTTTTPTPTNTTATNGDLKEGNVCTHVNVDGTQNVYTCP